MTGAPTKAKSPLFTKIGTTLVVPYLVGSLVSVGIMGALAYYNYRVQIANVNTLQEEVSRRVRTDINSFSENIITKLNLVALDTSLPISADTRSKILDNLLRQEPTVAVVSYVDVTGQELNKLARYQIEPPPRANIAGDEKFTVPLGGLTYTSSVFFSDFDLPSITVSVPAIEESGRIVGAVVAEVDLTPLWDSVTRARIGDSGYVYIVDAKGKLLIYKDIDVVKQQKDLSAISGVQGFIHKEQVNATYQSFVGERVIGAWQTIPGTDWGVVVELPQREVFEKVRPFLLAAGGAMVIALLFLVAFLLLLYYKVLTPMAVLYAGVLEIQRGNLAVNIRTIARNEVGKLSEAFNKMTTDLSSSRAKIEAYSKNLEGMVLERTHQLSEKVQEVERAKAKDDAILGSVGDGLIVVDDKGTILLVNDLAVSLLGKADRAELLGKPASSYTVYNDRKEPIASKDRPEYLSLVTGHKTLQDVLAIRPDGSQSALHITATPVLLGEQIVGAVQIVRDVTKEKEVDRMKTEFISLASHQLRTPLSAIKWFGEMLYGGDAGELTTEQKDFTKNIVDSTQRMIDLVSSLLNISRIESGRIIIDPKPTDLRELIQGIVNDLKGKTEEKKQNLAVSVHADLPKINLDPQLVGQVYLNLLTNAIKYTPEGGEIAVFVSREGDYVVSQVTDTGYGIPKEQQNRVFQKFFRAENVVKVIADGTGLGLYLVKAIIESSGGKIWFESEPGQGTTFWFKLPMSGMKAKAGEVRLG